jgi:hypothetical protein
MHAPCLVTRDDNVQVFSTTVLGHCYAPLIFYSLDTFSEKKV